ncbi:MAG: ATP synthase F1 subunit delta [Eggerthellaceae bacterium]
MPTNRHTAKAEAELYATTLLEALNSEGGLDAVMNGRTQIDTIVRYARANAQLNEVMADSSVAPEQRAQLVKRVFADCEPALVSVLAVMAERGDFSRLNRISDIYDAKIREKFNVCVVDVVTRVALDDHLREVIKNKAGRDLGCDVVLNESIDTNLLGGIIMSANGQRIDASVNTMLDNARTALKKN